MLDWVTELEKKLSLDVKYTGSEGEEKKIMVIN